MKLGGFTWRIRDLRFGLLALIILFLTSLLPFSSTARKNGEAPTSRLKSGRAEQAQQAKRPEPTPTPVIDQPPASSPTPPPNKKPAGNIANAQLAPSGAMPLLGDGTLTGRMFSSVPPSPVNLTTQGVLDWAHWGNGGPQVFDHKNGVTSQISNYAVIGTGQIFWLNDNPTGYSWSDGTPNPTATNVHSGIYAIGLGNGFEFTVPADTNPKTLRIYVGLWRARGRLEASLSDGSAEIYTDTSLVNELGTSNGLYTIGFSSASAGQTLTIRYTVATGYHTSGNVTLESATLVDGSDPDVRPTVSISSPADEATFNAGETLTVTANAFDPDGTVYNVEFFVDGFLLGAGTVTGTNQYSLTWNSVFAGVHTLTAVATDNEGAKTTSEAVSVTALPVTGGTLTGKLYSPSPPAPVNLTTEGELDWAHWGNGGPQVFDHKAGVTQQISNVKILGTSAPQWLVDNPTFFSWTDGTPNVTATNNRTGIFVSSVGNGFEITLPADTSFKTVRLYTGFWQSQTKLEAALSDGSAPTFIDTSLGGGPVQNGVYALCYRAASNGQTLRLRYTIQTDYNPPFGNIALEAVTLSNGGPPTVTLTSPVNGSIVSLGQMVNATASASDPSGITQVEFFLNGSSFSQITTPPYSIFFGVPSGTYSVAAVATNAKGITNTSASATVVVNAEPTVNAGYNQSITLPALVTLYGSASDDGQPASATLTTSWSKVSGPGTVSFGNPTLPVTTASFSSEGTYVLRLTANDGAASVSSDVSVGVNSSITLSLNSTADAHVRDGSSASTNFGNATIIEVQTAGTGENRDAYFKFDLTNVGDISNAKLRLYAALSAAGSVGTSVYPVANTSWTETSVNWNTRPALGSPILSNVNITGTTFAWYELDVTNYLVSEKSAGRNVVTLGLHNPSTSTAFIKINSKEAASNKPQLSVNTQEAAFVVSKTLGTVRNNLNGFVGMKFTVGPAPVVVTSLGRIFVSGNTGTHTVKLVTASSGSDVAGGSVSINMAAGTASNGFKYLPLAAPITLAANTAYYLASQETSGGDQWYDSNTVLTTATIASVNNAIQKPNNTWQSAGSANNSFGPVDFKYVSQTPLTTITYHLHVEGSENITSPPRKKLLTAGPDVSSSGWQTGNLKGQANGEKPIFRFDTQGSIIGRPGYIPSGSTTTFSLWMKNTGTAGTMFPRAKLFVNSEAGASICTATGTAALTTTLTKYTLSCSSSADISAGTLDRLFLWVGVNLTAGSSSKDFAGELDIEGVLNGNYDSQFTTRLPLSPTISAITPSIGPAGSNVAIAGINFGSLQGTSSVNFNGVPAVITSWSANSILTSAPSIVTTGPVVVTVNGIASNGVTFTVGLADSDADGLPDAWEIQYFGNLLQGANNDPDGDGVTNILEFYQGRNPTVGTVSDPTSWINLRLYSPVEP